ncbi:hypothetical protein XAC3218_1380013 [Xanthomonas citri pv. citri]|nr:hypothetical protein XAC3608_1610010 [Xanthomonas citri pv. citri]CEE77917.1 hypothetical protein XAC3218_1380013 [Xanthomonas citri pv. citri]CEH81821.1 hypothetical protein XACB302_10390013 [Xanthomonas citri pv. citri]CEI11764.1 hypothetical protein XACG115_2640013 [Xanthomonas citri pv. citri]
MLAGGLHGFPAGIPHLANDHRATVKAEMERLVGIGEAARALGVSITTLRRWEVAGRLSAEHTAGGHRRYDLAKLRPEMFRAEDEANRRTVAYARVSSHDQKDDLERPSPNLAGCACARRCASLARSCRPRSPVWPTAGSPASPWTRPKVRTFPKPKTKARSVSIWACRHWRRSRREKRFPVRSPTRRCWAACAGSREAAAARCSPR